jgi:hypothetical protein
VALSGAAGSSWACCSLDVGNRLVKGETPSPHSLTPAVAEAMVGRRGEREMICFASNPGRRSFVARPGLHICRPARAFNWARCSH